MTLETTTIRVPRAAKARLEQHANPGDSMGDVVLRLAQQVPTNTEVHQSRNAVAAYLRTYLVPTFGDQDEQAGGEALWAELRTLQYGEDADASQPTTAVLDQTALTALASGDRLLAQLLHTQPSPHARALFAPLQAVYMATVQQGGVAEHLDRLGVVRTIAFDFDDVLSVGKQVPSNATPALVHVVRSALPSPGWPVGRPVLTKVPGIYQPYRIKVRVLPESTR